MSSKSRNFRPIGTDALLEDRVVLSHATAYVGIPTPGPLYAQDLAYVQALNTFVGNPANTANTQNQALALSTGRLSRSQVVGQIVQTPQGARTIITDLFQTLLQRSPSSSELAFYTTSNHGRPQSIAKTTAQILGSNEYFNNHGATNASFVAAVYNDFLGRSPDASALRYVNLLNRGALRQHVAAQIIHSPGGSESQVFFAYTRVLGRAPDPSSQAFVNFINHGGTVEQVFGSLLVSNEFYANAQAVST